MENKEQKTIPTAKKKIVLPEKSQGNFVVPKKKSPQRPSNVNIDNANKAKINNTDVRTLTNHNATNKKLSDIESEYNNVIKKSKKKTKKVKKQRTLYAIFGIISDIFIYPIIIISLIACVAMYTSKSENVIPPIFGFSFVKVLSGSMTKSGFDVGEIVMINQNQRENVNQDDIVAFYYPTQSIADKASLTKVDSLIARDNDNITYEKDGSQQTISRSHNEYKIDKETLTKKARVYFHHILNIYIDTDEGIIYYETKGSSNNSADSYLIREDLIVGKYSPTPKFLRSALTFCSTSIGMILLVVIPLSILVLLESLNLIEQVNNLMIEKKVLKLQMRFDCEEALKANVAIELTDLNKIYLYDIVAPKDKDLLYEMQWGYMNNIKLSKKQIEYFDNVNKSLKVYSYEDSTQYWNFWDSQIKSARKRKKILDLRNNAMATKFAEEKVEKDNNEIIDKER